MPYLQYCLVHILQTEGMIFPYVFFIASLHEHSPVQFVKETHTVSVSRINLLNYLCDSGGATFVM